MIFVEAKENMETLKKKGGNLNMKKTCILLIIIMALGIWSVGVVSASTSAEKQAAIGAGLAIWRLPKIRAMALVEWCGGATFPQPSPAALLAFTEQSYKPSG